jgi:hypothetical protein
MSAASVLIPIIGLILVVALIGFVTMIGTHATSVSSEAMEALTATTRGMPNAGSHGHAVTATVAARPGGAPPAH